MTQKIEYSVFVDSARSLVERYGFASITISQIIYECNVSTRTFYNRVDIEELWNDVVKSLGENEMVIKRVYDLNKYCQRAATVRFVKIIADKMIEKGYMDGYRQKDKGLRATHS